MPFGQLPDRRPPFTHSRCALRNQIGEASDHPEADLLKLVEMPFAAFDLELFQGPQKREVDRARAAGVLGFGHEIERLIVLVDQRPIRIVRPYRGFDLEPSRQLDVEVNVFVVLAGLRESLLRLGGRINHDVAEQRFFLLVDGDDVRLEYPDQPVGPTLEWRFSDMAE